MVIGAGRPGPGPPHAPGHLDKAAGSPLGLVALGVAFMLFLTGFLLIRRITRIEI